MRIFSVLFQFHLVLVFLYSNISLASDCGWNSDYTLYSGCNSPQTSGSGGGASSRVGDSLNTNPAEIPTVESPFGLEGSFSDRSFPAGKRKFSVSTVKGFEGGGFGLGSWSDGTFSSPDFANHFLSSRSLVEFKKYQTNPPKSIGLRIGTSLSLPKVFFPKGILVSVGGSVGFGRVKGDWSPQVGVVAKILRLGLGFSNSLERISTLLPPIRISMLSAGLNFGILYLGYSRIILSSSSNRSTADVYGARLTLKPYTIYGNTKLQKDHRGAPDSWIRAGITKTLVPKLALGYEYGMYRYSHSALLQFFLF